MTQETNQPFDKIRDGALTATIWKNEHEKGVAYSVEFDRIYTDQEGNYQNSKSFSGAEILRVARLAEKAYDAIAEAKTEDREEAA